MVDTAVLLSNVRHVTSGTDGLSVSSRTSHLMFLGTCPKLIKLNKNAKNSLAMSQILYDNGQEQLDL